MAIENSIPIPIPEFERLRMPELKRRCKIAQFRRDLRQLINSSDMEGVFGDTPDYLLADYAVTALEMVTRVVVRRDRRNAPTEGG